MDIQKILEQDYIDGKEAAEILKITPIRVRKLCQDGRFKGAIKFARSWLIPREAVLNHKHLKPGPKSKADKHAEDIALLKSALEEAQKTNNGAE